MNFLDAHSPYNPPHRALDALGLSPARRFDRYETHRPLTHALPALGPDAVDEIGQLYDAELRGLDDQLGPLLDWLDERLGRNAVLVVTADHGEELGEAGRVGQRVRRRPVAGARAAPRARTLARAGRDPTRS